MTNQDRVHFGAKIVKKTKSVTGGDTNINEECYVIREGKESLVSVHKDASDKKQQIFFPEIHTNATDTATKSHSADAESKSVTIQDKAGVYTDNQERNGGFNTQVQNG